MIEGSWDLKKLERQMKEWTRKPASLNLHWTNPVASIRRMTVDEFPEQEFLPPLCWVGIWEGTNGVLAILSSDQGGWARLAASANFWYLYLRILIHRFDIDTRPNKRGVAYAVQVAHCCAHLVANEWIDQAKWLGDRLARGFSDGATSAWPGTPFEPFMACLYQRWQQIPSGQGLPTVELGVYKEVLDCLEDDADSFNAALSRACDYHASRIDDPDDNSGYPEFFHPVYNVFPAEIIAVQRVRAWLGKDVPPLKHEILDNPLSVPPKPMPSGEHELWRLAEHKAKSIWPDF